MANDDYSPERMADRAQITDAILRYCRGIDRQDFDVIRSAFHADAVDDHGIYNGGIDGLIDWIRERHVSIPFTMHSMSNILIEFAGPDTALVESYCFSVQRYTGEASASLAQLAGSTRSNPNAESDLMACVRYVDRFERRAGLWRIQHRTAVYDSTMLFEVGDGAPKIAPSWTRGQRHRGDFLYTARRQCGLPD